MIAYSCAPVLIADQMRRNAGAPPDIRVKYAETSTLDKIFSKHFKTKCLRTLQLIAPTPYIS